MRRQEQGPCALLAVVVLLLALTACNPFAPPPLAPTPTPPAEYIERANRSYQSGMDKLSRGDYRGAIQDLEDARVYMPAGDPRIAELDQALAQARAALTPTAVTPTAAVPTPSGPPTPSRAVPNVALGDQRFGRVYPAVVPPVASVPPPTSVFSDSDQVAVYVPRLAEVTEFRLRVFRDPTGEFVAEVGSQAPADPPVEWYDTLVWYHEGPEAVGDYRVELYAGNTLTNVLNFTVRQQVAQVVTPAATSGPGVTVAPPPPPPGPRPTTAPPAPAPPPPPPSATPQPTPAPTATPRPPAPAALGEGEWRPLGTIESNGTNGGLVRALVTSPQGGGTLFAGTDKGVFRSQDGGDTWQLAQMPTGAPPIRSMAISPRSGLVYAAGTPDEPTENARQGIYRSQDNGASFVEYALLGRRVQRIGFSPDGSAMYAATWPSGPREPGTLYRSTDEGATWAPVLNLGGVSLFFTGLVFSPSYGPDRTIYVTAGSVPGAEPTPVPGRPQAATQPQSYGTVFRSTDDGRTWLVRDRLAGDEPLASVWTLTTTGSGNGYTLYAGTDSGVAMSANAGDTWTRAADATNFAGNKYVVRLVTPGAGGLVGVLCPQENAERPRDKGGISWKNCRTATWSASSGRWSEIEGEIGTGGDSTIGALDIARGGSGTPPIYLGLENGQVYLYSIPP
ncbi:MAG TPA: hypothetical protein VK066_08715 [Chloroflexota bacterium]|nr:hypothetical protein [Chloroflexota bacterium]